MKAQKLTRSEKELFDHLQSTPGGILRKHIKGTGTLCYRLLDGAKNPLRNYRQGLVDQLKDKDVIELQGWDYVLKATSEESKPKASGIGGGLSYSTTRS